MAPGPLLRSAKYAPVVGLVALFLASFAFAFSAGVTQRHVALTATVSGAVVSYGGVGILRDPALAARHDTVLTATRRDSPPTPFATTVMTAGGLALALGGVLLVAAALRLL